VLIGAEFTGFRGRDNEEAMLHGTQIGDDRARLTIHHGASNTASADTE
jgi:hypothetical protein